MFGDTRCHECGQVIRGKAVEAKIPDFSATMVVGGDSRATHSTVASALTSFAEGVLRMFHRLCYKQAKARREKEGGSWRPAKRGW